MKLVHVKLDSFETLPPDFKPDGFVFPKDLPLKLRIKQRLFSRPTHYCYRRDEMGDVYRIHFQMIDGYDVVVRVEDMMD